MVDRVRGVGNVSVRVIVQPRHARRIGERVLIAEVVGGKAAFLLRVGEGELQGIGKGIDIGYRRYKSRVSEAYRVKGDGERRVGRCWLRRGCLLRTCRQGKGKEHNKGEGNEVHEPLPIEK